MRRIKVCTCSAYKFPHRAGGGRCQVTTVQEAIYKIHRMGVSLAAIADYSHIAGSADPVDILTEMFLNGEFDRRLP